MALHGVTAAVYLFGLGMLFTGGNVGKVVQKVWDADRLMMWLGVPEWKETEIKKQCPGDLQLRQCIKYFVDHNPVASWRSVIVALDGMGEKEVADEIRHLAEPVIGKGRWY